MSGALDSLSSGRGEDSSEKHEITGTVEDGTLKATTPNRVGDGLDWYTVGLLPGNEWKCSCGETFYERREIREHPPLPDVVREARREVPADD